MPSDRDADSVLLTNGEGAVYRVPVSDLAEYQLPVEEAEALLDEDVTGFGPMSMNFSLIGTVRGTGAPGKGAPGLTGGTTGGAGGTRSSGGSHHGGWDQLGNTRV